MIKLNKRDIGTFCVVKWFDAWTEFEVSTPLFLSKGLAVNRTPGWISTFTNKVLVMKVEECDRTEADHTMIPRTLIREIVFYDEGKGRVRK